MEPNKFIELVLPLARNEYLTRERWVLPSVCIAQAALETGWGTSKKMMISHAIFGIKAGKSWRGKVYSSKTNECYDGVTYTQITDLFRAYDSYEESVKDYYDLITSSSRYEKAINNSDAFDSIKQIWEGGYATGPKYVENVSTIIREYDLTKYDSRDSKLQEACGINVSKKVVNILAYLAMEDFFGSGEIRKKHLGDLYRVVQDRINEIWKGVNGDG